MNAPSAGGAAFRNLLVSFWFGVLILPFRGIVTAAAVAGAVFACLSLYRPLASYLPSLRLRLTRTEDLILRLTSGPAAPFAGVIAAAVLLFIPVFASNYLLDILILTGIYGILAFGLNVVVGFTGMLNLGYVAFYALGAYAYALLNVKLGMGLWQALPVCVALTTAAGFCLAVPALRLKGDYFAIVTLGFGEIVRLVLNNWDSFTNGPNGISGITPASVAGTSLGALDRYYYLVLAAIFAAYAVVRRVRFSRIGRAWVAIREDEIAAGAMGINTTVYKLYAMAFGSFWAGLAGALFAAKMQFVSPESFTFMESVLILCMVILGGLGSLAGVAAGALILILLPELLRGVQSYRMIALSAGIILLMIFRPGGLFGSATRER